MRLPAENGPIPVSAGFILLLVLGDTTISEQLDSVDVAAIIGSEEQGYFAHIIRCANSTERHVSYHARLLFVGHQNRDRVIELRLAAASEEDSSAFVGETLSGAKANAGTAAGHNCYFVFEFPVHESIYL
jgi:hypothetical protein